MRNAPPIGRVAGIPIAVHWSALVAVVLLAQFLALTVLPSTAPAASWLAYWLVGSITALGLIASLLAHELGHALVARRAGLGVRRITLWLLGGLSELGGQPSKPGDEIRVAAVGPAVSLGLGGLFVAIGTAVHVLGGPALAVAALSWLASMNLVLGLFNLLPGTPLDGGRLLHGLLWRHSGDQRRATRTAATSGQVLGALLAAFGILLTLRGRLDGIWLILVGWFLAGSASAEGAAVTNAAQLAGLRAGDVMSTPPFVAPEWWTVQAFIDHLLREKPKFRTFPVVDFDGRCTGVVSTSDLLRSAPADRASTAIRQLAHPLPIDLVLAPQTPLTQLLTARSAATSGLAVVVAEGRLVGVLTRSDLTRALERATLCDIPAKPGLPR